MTERYTDIALGLLLAWVFWGVGSLFTGSLIAMILGAAVAFLALRYLRSTVVLRGLVAVLEPIGIVIPLLILRQALGAMGLPIAPFGGVELFLFLLLYIAFLASAFAVLPVQLYRYGYQPVPVALLVLALCLYGGITGNLFVPLVAVAGQALWVFKIGSSNYFDHILHATLVPVAGIALLSRLIW